MTEKLRVLVAEGPSGQTASVLRRLFSGDEGGMQLTEVSGVSTLMASLQRVSPQVILLDLTLGNPDVLGTVRMVHRSKPEIPLIVIGDPAKKEIAVASLREGALDYLLKSHLDPQTLDRVLRSALERNTLKGLADLLRDPITGLHIRDGFLTLGSHIMEAARDRRGTLVLLCARFENLERIRKKVGEHAAESSLREIGMLLTRSFRRTDLLARIGESQFAALAVDAIEPSAPVLLQRLRKRVEAFNSGNSRWGPLELRMVARFWAGKGARTFAEFLDEVEAALRNPAAGQEVQKTARFAEPRLRP
ncbi:MAG TPA: diguanylate cyclase [Candidatus Acidoferrum sp.]|nr:diguanylate cyclase [Candidatus Acidoferrum sp.]